jgi:hypothetical protein
MLALFASSNWGVGKHFLVAVGFFLKVTSSRFSFDPFLNVKSHSLNLFFSFDAERMLFFDALLDPE